MGSFFLEDFTLFTALIYTVNPARQEDGQWLTALTRHFGWSARSSSRKPALTHRSDRRRRADQPRPRIPLEVRFVPRRVHHLLERHPQAERRAHGQVARRRPGRGLRPGAAEPQGATVCDPYSRQGVLVQARAPV